MGGSIQSIKKVYFYTALFDTGIDLRLIFRRLRFDDQLLDDCYYWTKIYLTTRTFRQLTIRRPIFGRLTLFDDQLFDDQDFSTTRTFRRPTFRRPEFWSTATIGRKFIRRPECFDENFFNDRFLVDWHYSMTNFWSTDPIRRQTVGRQMFLDDRL